MPIGVTLAAMLTLGACAPAPTAPSRTQTGATAAPDITKIDLVRRQFGRDFTVGDSQRTTVTPEIIRQHEQSGVNYIPNHCEFIDQTVGPDSIGATFITFTAEGKGTTYTVSAQRTSIAQPAPSENCDYAQINKPGRFQSLVTPADLPRIPKGSTKNSTARHIVSISEPQKLVIDQYRYMTWLDDNSAVSVVVVSNPFAVPASNPIDPKFAQDVLSDAVAVLRSK
ncbi:DUF5642 family protein [Mycolicibacterium mucogenicum]|uniref:DUF5642 family protein n=2 Tax=Mycolicibacterium mucogenicum TaxID=56689 RepID=A0A8E4R4H3_MYCMU|nr:DUF5642 family protein [Mycolicibacterium mucogenicum DSM 44124]